MQDKGKILIIDDDNSVIKLLTEILEIEGYDIVSSTDSIYGLELFKEEKF